MNTIKKLSVEINKLDGLKICKLENSEERDYRDDKSGVLRWWFVCIEWAACSDG